MSNTEEPKGESDLLDSINNTGVKGFHYKTWLIAGMGFFTDAYDLFIIGAVLALLPLAGWAALSVGAKSLIASTALLSAVIGAVVFRKSCR